MSLETYEKLRVVGKGSYGEVWLVSHKKDNKQYVIKKMAMKNASKRERKAAEQEAKLLSKLRHPNIVSYRDSFEDENGYLYIAMGFCEGGDLYQRLKEQKGKALEEIQIVEWFIQIAMALQYLHEMNILHRDLKTQNIFLTKGKIIKVGDLGIARVLEGSTDMATTLIGTPYYMSPELFSNKPYNHKSDVWALGCCVYEMTTLKHAFNAKDMNSLVYKILRGKLPSMPKYYSAELLELIKVMLHQSPDKRPSVARVLRNPFVKKHISLFLEGTRSRRPGSAGSDSGSGRRKTAKPEIIQVVEKPLETDDSMPAIPEASVSQEQRAAAKGPASAKSAQPARKSSADKVLKKKKVDATGDAPSKNASSEKKTSAVKRRPLPPAPAKTEVAPRKSSSGKSRLAAAEVKSGKGGKERGGSVSSVSSVSSLSNSKEESSPRAQRQSASSSARARRREKLRESQEKNPTAIPVIEQRRRESESSSVDTTDGGKPRAHSAPTQRDVESGRSKLSSNSSSRDGSCESSEDEEQHQKEREEKEMKKFSNLLETTLHLEKKERDSPEGDDLVDGAKAAQEASAAAEAQRESEAFLIIEPAAPKAPKGFDGTMTASGRLLDRISLLRKDIILGLGIEVMKQAYDILENEDESNMESELLELMGKEKFDIYAGKIWQLKFCEETVLG